LERLFVACNQQSQPNKLRWLEQRKCFESSWIYA
jgi:hypothetical protein